MNEASARIKINKLLEAAGWRFFDEPAGPANIQLETGVKLRHADLDGLGNDFEHVTSTRGVVDFLLLDDRGFPLVVLEAKSEAKDPLTGKEQARSYARSQNCRFVILSNGDLHFFWDLEHGNPRVITVFPAQDSVGVYKQFAPNPKRLADQRVRDDYIVLTQRPTYASEAAWRNEDERPDYVRANNLRFLREYQVRAVHALQRAVRDGADRFLFEMATGTGKTLTAAAVIKLFLRTGNARRVLFLVDRLELEQQARGVFTELLSKDFRTAVYKENRNDWRSAEIVVSTVQSLLFDNKYRRLFSPTDFIQIKGRGTRLHDFRDDLIDKDLADGIERPEKTAFKLFDFFGNNEYFEEDFNYDEVLQLPAGHSENGNGGEVDPVESVGVYEHAGGDTLYSIRQETVGYQGMKIDRMFFDRFVDTVREDAVIAEAVEAEQWDRAVDHVSRHLFERPEDYFNLAKLRRAVDADRRLSLPEILEHVFGRIERFKTTDELLDEEFAKFIADRQPGQLADIPALRSYFKAYAADERTRRIIEDRKYTDLDTNPTFTLNDFIGISDEYRSIIPEYIKDYVSINQFIS